MIDIIGLKARTDIVAVVSHYVQPLVKVGREYRGRCVWHSPDNHPSMWVVPEKGLIHCFACGGSGDIVDFVRHMEHCGVPQACELLGATSDWKPSIADVPRIERPNRVTSKPPADAGEPDMEIRGRGEPVARWLYRDADGAPLGYVARYDGPEGKDYFPWTWGAYPGDLSGWGCGQWNRPRPLYGLDVLAAKPDAPVIVCEGEKAADSCQALLPAYAVVTWPGGAQAWDRTDLAPLAGRTVLLWPDADPPGVEAMTRLASALADPRGIAANVSILDVSGMPDGYDAADFEGDTTALIAWARPRKRSFAIEPAKPAIAPDALPTTEAGSGDDPSPDMGENPPAPPASLPEAERPARKRPQLAIVGGQATAPALDPDLDALPQALSDNALADYFALHYADSLQFVPEWSSSDKPLWLQWQGDYWKRDVLERYFNLACSVCTRACYWPEAAALSPKEKRALDSTGKAASFLQAAKRHPKLTAHAAIWDADQWLLGVPGGTVDLRTGAMREPDTADRITRRCLVAPAAGPHPLFDSVLTRATGGDPGMAAFMWRWFGYVASGQTNEEAFLFLHGQGGSGKSTLTKAVGEILGDYAMSCKMETFAETNQPRHAEELARLDGARLVLTSETDEGQRWNESRIKWLTGRNKVTANYMRANSFEYVPRFKLLIEGNHRPGLKSVGEEMRRRIHLVEYAGIIPEAERDKQLKDKLVAEYPMILASIIRGCLDWQRQGLAPPDAVRDAVKDYLESEDTIGAWLDECCERKDGAPVMASAAYKSFRTWAEAHGEYCPSQKRFSQKIEDRGIHRRRTAAGVQFAGLSLKLADVPPYDFDR